MDPQVERLIAMLKAATPADAPKMWQLTVADARARSELFFALFNEGGAYAGCHSWDRETGKSRVVYAS